MLISMSHALIFADPEIVTTNTYSGSQEFSIQNFQEIDAGLAI